jgi:hypothetical protein
MIIASGLDIICQPSLNFYVVLLRLLSIMFSLAIAVLVLVRRVISNAT